MKTARAAYLDTGTWSAGAIKEAKPLEKPLLLLLQKKITIIFKGYSTE
jgi:phosphoserine aminotransferase